MHFFVKRAWALRKRFDNEGNIEEQCSALCVPFVPSLYLVLAQRYSRLSNRPALSGTVPLSGKLSPVPHWPSSGRSLSRFTDPLSDCPTILEQRVHPKERVMN